MRRAVLKMEGDFLGDRYKSGRISFALRNKCLYLLGTNI